MKYAEPGFEGQVLESQVHAKGHAYKKTSLSLRLETSRKPPSEKARTERGEGERQRKRERERKKSLLAKTLFPRLSKMCSDRQKSRPPAGQGVSIAHSLHICKHRNRNTFERKYGVREVGIFLYYQYRPRAF